METKRQVIYRIKENMTLLVASVTASMLSGCSPTNPDAHEAMQDFPDIDPLVQSLIAGEGWVNDALDEIGCACIDKEFSGELEVSHPESIVALVWNGYGISMNAGVIVAMDRFGAEELTAALREIDCDNIADALDRISDDRKDFEGEWKLLSPEERESYFADLVFGRWKGDWNLFYEEDAGFVEQLASYIQEHARSFRLQATL